MAHGNKGKVPCNIYSPETLDKVALHFLNYTMVLGLPMLAAPRQIAVSTYLPPRLLLLTRLFGRSMAPPNMLATKHLIDWLLDLPLMLVRGIANFLQFCFSKDIIPRKWRWSITITVRKWRHSRWLRSFWSNWSTFCSSSCRPTWSWPNVPVSQLYRFLLTRKPRGTWCNAGVTFNRLISLAHSLNNFLPLSTWVTFTYSAD